MAFRQSFAGARAISSRCERCAESDGVMSKRVFGAAFALFCALLMSLAVQPPVQAARTGITPTPTPAARVYLPLLFKQAKPPPPFVCPTSSTNGYDSGEARQYDGDDPVRPAAAHADKNLALRGYVSNADAGLRRELVNYGTDDPTRPPQFATLFDPVRVPPLSGFYRVHDWNWAASPAPGSRGDAADDLAGDRVRA